MTYYGGKDIARSFRTVRNNTLQIAREIPDNKYDFSATPETRTVARTLVHIALVPRIALHVHRNNVSDLATVNFMEVFGPLMAEETKPRSKDEIIAVLETEGEEFAAFVDGVPDAFLAETVKLPFGEQPFKTRFEMLISPKEHEMHHRGQLMVLQRMIGLKPHLTRQMEERMAQMQAAAAPQSR